MYKKICVMVLMFLALTVFAYPDATTLSQTYVSPNTSGSNSTTYVSTATIIPGIHRIVSMSVCPINSSAAASIAAIYDAKTAPQVIESNLKAECASVANSSNDRIFPYPKTVTNGLTIVQSNNTMVTIEYTR
jgi:hypothetical protein